MRPEGSTICSRLDTSLALASPLVPDRFAPLLAELSPLADRFRGAGRRLYLVGGTVRDLLVGREVVDQDVDATTDARPDEIKAILDGWAEAMWTQGERFGTSRCPPGIAGL